MSSKKLLINMFALLMSPLVFIGCKKPINTLDLDLQNSKEIWQKRLSEIKIGANAEDIKAWQDKYQVSLSYYDNRYSTSNLTNGYFAVKNPVVVCDGFFLHLTITVDEQHKVSDKKLQSLGSCL